MLSDTVSELHGRAQRFAKYFTYDVVDSLNPGQDNQTAKTLAYYFMFAATCSAIHEAGKAVFPGYTWSKRAVVGTLGGLLQGDPSCPAQQAIEKYPWVAFLTGALNGIFCCWAHPYPSNAIGWVTGSNNLGVFITSVAIMPAVCKFVMCPIENAIKCAADQFMSPVEGVRSPTSVCCRN